MMEQDSHNKLLEQEKMTRLLSGGFYHLGMVQLDKLKGVDQSSREASSYLDKVDWLESQKRNAYAHSYEMIFRGV